MPATALITTTRTGRMRNLKRFRQPPLPPAGETTLMPVAPYILTPAAPATPRINGANVFGVRPGSPFLFTIPATGERPMEFSAARPAAWLETGSANRPHHRRVEQPRVNSSSRCAPKIRSARRRKNSASSAATRLRSRRRWAGTVGIVSPARFPRSR